MFNNIKSKYKIETKIILIFAFLFFVNRQKLIIIDNLISESFYQEDRDFSEFDTNLKVLAIYYPQNYITMIDYIDKKIIKSQMNKKDDYNIHELLTLNQVKLAKKHGIFGFGIVYNLINHTKFNVEILDLFLYEKMKNFPFFIIIDNIDNIYYQNLNSLIQNSTLIEKRLTIFIDGIKKYLISQNYIKINGKYILGIFNSSLSFKFINYIRRRKIIIGKTSIYIISIFHKSINFEYLNSTFSFLELPSKEIWLEHNLGKKYFYNYYYDNLFIKKNAYQKNITTFSIVNGCNPEKFYILFRKYLNLTNEIYKLLLINAWNNYQENLYLEPNAEFGFSYLNYFSKALFNLDDDTSYNLDILKNKCKIAIQVHLFYEDLIKDIINITNNIPVKFDLYITIVNSATCDNLMNYIKNLSKANHFELLNVENKGRDVLPFLNQMKTKFKLYKYLCHLHTKKTKKVPEIGFLWRNYLFNNLLGNPAIISQILYDFENKSKLGFIFPETFYGIIKYFYKVKIENKTWMDFLAYKLFHNCKIGEQINYPAGNMFWSKIAAIYQIFSYDLSVYFPKEKNQTDNTIMHGIERFWLYLVKYNHFYYKILFKIF